MDLCVDQAEIETERREGERSWWDEEHGGIQGLPRHLKSRSTKLNLDNNPTTVQPDDAVMYVERKPPASCFRWRLSSIATEQA